MNVWLQRHRVLIWAASHIQNWTVCSRLCSAATCVSYVYAVNGEIKWCTNGNLFRDITTWCILSHSQRSNSFSVSLYLSLSTSFSPKLDPILHVEAQIVGAGQQQKWLLLIGKLLRVLCVAAVRIEKHSRLIGSCKLYNIRTYARVQTVILWNDVAL